jgi:hypothetical protein
MTNLDQTVLLCPERLGEVFLDGVEDVMGLQAMQAVFDQAGLPHVPAPLFYRNDLGRVLSAVVKVYGLQAGYGLALCTGRACFKYGIMAFGAELGLDELKFRLKPPAVRINDGLDLLARIFHQSYGTVIRIDQDLHRYYWVMERGVVFSGESVCLTIGHLVTGVLQEFLYWAGGGKNYVIEVHECTPKNEERSATTGGTPAFSIEIDKRPLD